MTITSFLAIVLIALYGLAIVATPFAVGKKREPLTAKNASMQIITASIMIYLLLQLL